jgi:hypothetical protein
MLTLLQSFEAGRSAELKDSALGHYYQFLLTSAFQAAGVKAEKLNEYFQYCAALAWAFHVSGETVLTHAELIRFNGRYSREWSTNELGPMLETLERARVLSRTDDQYSFRYPYIFYFLKGIYVSERLTEEDMQAYVADCCKHLYVRDNANTILFLAHHAAGDFVIRQIQKSLESVFSEHQAIELHEDLSAVTRLISTAPKLAYEGGKPEEHRARRDRLDDETDDGSDGLADQPENDDKLSLGAKLATLSKTCEILGQVLKDQYAKVPRLRREELVSVIFSGSLRAMADFFHFMDQHSEVLISGLRARMAHEGVPEKSADYESFARQYIAGLVQAVTFGLVMRAAQNVGSDNLREDVTAVVERSPTLALEQFRLLPILTRLSRSQESCSNDSTRTRSPMLL